MNPQPDQSESALFPERVTLDRCTNCGWITTGAWMHGPCPVCEGERYEAGEYLRVASDEEGQR